MTSSRLSCAFTPLSLAPFWLTSTVVTFSENILPLQSVPKMRTGTSTGIRGSRRFPMLRQDFLRAYGTGESGAYPAQLRGVPIPQASRSRPLHFEGKLGGRVANACRNHPSGLYKPFAGKDLGQGIRHSNCSTSPVGIRVSRTRTSWQHFWRKILPGATTE